MNETELKYAPLTRIAEAIDMPLASLKVRLHVAQKRGIKLPERRRIGRQFFYNKVDFVDWLWRNASELQRTAFDAERESK